MVQLTDKSLMYFEDLTVPTVIVMSGSMRCVRCRERVTRIISKITGLREYTVDLLNRQVIVMGDFRNQHKEDNYYLTNDMKKTNCHPFKLLFGLFVPNCFTKYKAS
ncbi:Heavy metal transport/detoxification superfamily protein [Euphorbia peplus]|nr:Heavy metal transport/detoxification superfamily protein [Euphorbia peplus]